MKFIHVADVHLGAAPESDMEWAKKRPAELYQSFYQILELCGQEQADLLLIAGDLFHRQPSMQDLKEMNYRLGSLEPTRVVLIAGNHDFIGARSAYEEMEWSPNVTMLCGREMDSVYFEELNTEVYGFSYHTRDIYEPRYDQARPQVRERINILLAHGGDAKDIPIDRNRLKNAGFDYVALGHIHKPEMISKRMAYCGSPEPLDKTETGEHGVIIGEITKKTEEVPEEELTDGQDPESEIALTFLPCALRRYLTLTLRSDAAATNASMLEEAAKRIEEAGSHNIFRIVLTGIRDEVIRFVPEDFMELGNIADVTDETVPDYDFDALMRENSDNIIGMYIEKIRSLAGDNEALAGKALYYGMEALLGAGRKAGERSDH